MPVLGSSSVVYIVGWFWRFRCVVRVVHVGCLILLVLVVVVAGFVGILFLLFLRNNFDRGLRLGCVFFVCFCCSFGLWDVFSRVVRHGVGFGVVV